jgi:anti-anti-sigma factor
VADHDTDGKTMRRNELPSGVGDETGAGCFGKKGECVMFLRKPVNSDEIVLEIKGPLSGENTNEFHKHLQELSAEKCSTVTLNLLEVSTINSSSLGKILLFRKKLSEEGRTLKIRGCSDALHKTFQMIKFDKLISIEKKP